MLPWGRLVLASVGFGVWSVAASWLVYGLLLKSEVVRAFEEHPGMRPAVSYALRHYLGSFLLHIGMGFMWGAAMARFIVASTTDPWLIGLQFGLFAWLVFAVPITCVKAIWTTYPRQLVVANLLYWALLCAGGGAVLGWVVLRT